jgi:hypothetical protein
MCGRYDNLIPAEAYPRIFKPTRVPQSGVEFTNGDAPGVRLRRGEHHG